MNITIISWDGHNINDGSSYRAKFLGDKPFSPMGEGVYARRSGEWPMLATVTRQPLTVPLTIEALGTAAQIADNMSQLAAWFSLEDDLDAKKLLVKDEDDTQWYVMGYTKTAARYQGSNRVIVVQIMLDGDPYWTAETATVTNWAVTATADKQNVIVGGNLNAYPTFAITPTGARSAGGYAYRKWVGVYNTISESVPYGPLDITNGGWDTATLIAASHMQADGDDLRVLDGYGEIKRWFQSINNAATKVWVNLSFAPKIELVLKDAIAGSGAVTELHFKHTTNNKNALKNLPDKGLIAIANEIFYYDDKAVDRWRVMNVTRAERDSAMAAHSTGDTARWIEHDIWLVYGNADAENPAATDQGYDDEKPIIDLTSTNSSWVYTAFAAETARTAQWTPAVLATGGGESYTYTGAHTVTGTYPATEMGMGMRCAEANGKWMGETARLEWRVYIPQGMTNVNASGDKYKALTSFPTVRFQKSKNGRDWGDPWSETTVASAATWTAWTHNQALSGTYNYARFLMSGSIPAGANNEADFEVQGVTLTLDSTRCPAFIQPAATTQYYLDCTITNNTSGEYITVQWPLSIDHTITVNTGEKLITYEDGTEAAAVVQPSSVRRGWLDLLPNQTNELQFDDTGTGNVTVVVTHRNRKGGG